MLETNYERLGLLLLGCCPGGVGSNFWTAMLDGDINLSVTMTFFSSVSAFAMTSFWIWMLGSTLVTDDLPMPYIQLATALVSFAVPVLLGMAAKKVVTSQIFPKTLPRQRKSCCTTMIKAIIIETFLGKA